MARMDAPETSQIFTLSRWLMCTSKHGRCDASVGKLQGPLPATFSILPPADIALALPEAFRGDRSLVYADKICALSDGDEIAL